MRYLQAEKPTLSEKWIKSLCLQASLCFSILQDGLKYYCSKKYDHVQATIIWIILEKESMRDYQVLITLPPEQNLPTE